MDPVLVEAIQSSIMAILVALVGILTDSIVKWLKEKRATEGAVRDQAEEETRKAQMETTLKLVDIGVDAAEQVYKALDGPAKKEEAKKIILGLLNSEGINISEEQLNDFIEGAVGHINRGKQEVIDDFRSDFDGEVLIENDDDLSSGDQFEEDIKHFQEQLDLQLEDEK